MACRVTVARKLYATYRKVSVALQSIGLAHNRDCAAGKRCREEGGIDRHITLEDGVLDMGAVPTASEAKAGTDGFIASPCASIHHLRLFGSAGGEWASPRRSSSSSLSHSSSSSL